MMSGKFYFKVHKHPSEVVITICDEEVLGKTFHNDKMKIAVTEGFYGGDLVEEEFVRINIGSFTILNIVGERIVAIAIDEGFISPEHVLEIGEVKHAQAVRI